MLSGNKTENIYIIKHTTKHEYIIKAYQVLRETQKFHTCPHTNIRKVYKFNDKEWESPFN